MKKKVTREIQVDVEFCNICEKEITVEAWNRKRIEIVRQLFKTDNFNAHEVCINQVVKEAFQKYFPEPSKRKNKNS